MTAKRDVLHFRPGQFALLALALAGIGSAAAAEGVVVDRAGNRLEPLIAQPASSAPEEADVSATPRLCTADRQWCVRTVRQGEPIAAHVEVEQQVAGEDEPRLRFVPLAAGELPGSEQPWPYIVRMAPGIGGETLPTGQPSPPLENVLVGVLRETATGFSGGSAHVSRLNLIRIYHREEGIQIDPELAVLPADGAAQIRACFSEADTQARAGACHDAYTFATTLTLDPAGTAMPVLRYRTTATRYPVGASRRSDALARGPLRREDLRTETVAACSYQRVLRFVDGAYVVDAPLPDCADFTDL
ncbi:hypothetical protein [Stenotrophomonas sp.]|uniref:hypothetical protein n=1 Tax=Stenotrophomonas sp. TaxID=69392 RepID=UPI002FC7EBBF